MLAIVFGSSSSSLAQSVHKVQFILSLSLSLFLSLLWVSSHPHVVFLGLPATHLTKECTLSKTDKSLQALGGAQHCRRCFVASSVLGLLCPEWESRSYAPNAMCFWLQPVISCHLLPLLSMVLVHPLTSHGSLRHAVLRVPRTLATGGVFREAG